MFTIKEILKISLPIMVGSAVQNIVTLTDLIFLSRVGETELGAIGIVGVYYLIITSIGYGFSKGGQILIARRYGENKTDKIGIATWSLLAFEMMLALVMYLVTVYLAPLGFYQFLNDKGVYEKCMEYLDYRIPGVFFSYAAVTFVALYTGVGRTTVIIYNAVLLGIMNVALNYCLVFGNFGFPKMEMGGAALASTLSEVIAFSIFIAFIFIDRVKLKEYGFFNLRPKYDGENSGDVHLPGLLSVIDITSIKTQLRLSVPIVAQTIIGQGSWLVFFILVEHLGKTELAISNIIRAVYLIFMVPGWGLSSAINTIVSQLMGQRNIKQIFPVITKTAFLSALLTMSLSMTLVFFPDQVLFIFSSDATHIQEAKPLIGIFMVILFMYSISAIYFNGMAGTGATGMGLNMQIACVVAYLVYVYFVVLRYKMGLTWAWSAELVYWCFLLVLSIWYLRGKRWHGIRV